MFNKRETEEKNIRNSISAFFTSKNCNRSSAEDFYNSYILRKKVVIEGKTHALEKGSPVNQKKLNWELYILELVKRNKDFAMDIIRELLKRPVSIEKKDDLLRRAKRVLES